MPKIRVFGSCITEILMAQFQEERWLKNIHQVPWCLYNDADRLR